MSETTHRFPSPPPTLPPLSPAVRALVECDNATLREAILYLEVKLTLLKLEEEVQGVGFGPNQFTALSRAGAVEVRLASLRLMERVTSAYASLAANGVLAAHQDDGRR